MCAACRLAQSIQTAADDEELTAMQLTLRSHSTARVGVLGIVVAAGAFGLAAMMSAVTAPTVRADDFTEILSAVEGDFTDGQAQLTLSAADFGSGDPSDGLATFFNGVDDDLVSPGNNLYLGTVDALTNQPVETSFDFELGPEANFTDGVSTAESLVTQGESYLSMAATDLAGSDFAGAAYDSTIGSDTLFVATWEALIMGAAGSLGF
jgi:hypothetical protein